jgi:hypothetical protein
MVTTTAAMGALRNNRVTISKTTAATTMTPLPAAAML